jgi:hypothetical protein
MDSYFSALDLVADFLDFASDAEIFDIADALAAFAADRNITIPADIAATITALNARYL